MEHTLDGKHFEYHTPMAKVHAEALLLHGVNPPLHLDRYSGDSEGYVYQCYIADLTAAILEIRNSHNITIGSETNENS